MITLSPDQQKVLDTLVDWAHDHLKAIGENKQFITLGGYAGTGKTTLLGLLRQEIKNIDDKIVIAFCSYTGKASRVLKQKLKDADALLPKDTVGTIHSLIYSPVTNNKEEIIGWDRKPKIDADLIIVDEASMVDENIWKDLLSYKLPIIAVGDHGQLPPINGKFNLMDNPHLRLEKIHRQAEDNPIIKISMLAREEGKIPAQYFGYNVAKYSRSNEDTREVITELINSFNSDTLLLCGYNHTRVKLNQYVRQSLERFNPTPEGGDRVICLRNNHSASVFNGMLGTIVSITEEKDEDGTVNFYHAKINMDGEDSPYKGLIYAEQFNSLSALNFTEKRKEIGVADLFDFGYALTVHKSQGSQAKRVILFEERFKQMDDENWKKWLYTGVTRAEEELIIVGE